MNMMRARLLEFHRAVRQPALDSPQVPTDDRVRLRARLVVEEALEFLEAVFWLVSCDGRNSADRQLRFAREYLAEVIDGAPVRVDLPAAADALADLAYVVEGSNLEFGIDSGPVLDEVHRANMAKVHGRVREDGKALKPPGWKPPDVAGVLDRQRKRSKMHGRQLSEEEAAAVRERLGIK